MRHVLLVSSSAFDATGPFDAKLYSDLLYRLRKKEPLIDLGHELPPGRDNRYVLRLTVLPGADTSYRQRSEG